MNGDDKSPLKVKGRQNDMEKTVKYRDGMDVGFIIDSTNCGLCKKVGVGTWHIVLYFSIKNRTNADIRITNLNAKLDLRPSSDSVLTVGSREVVDLRNKDSLLRENKYYDLVPNEEQPITGELEAVSWFRSPSNRIDSQCALLFSLSVDYRAIESDRTFNVVIPVFYWFDSDVSSGQSDGRLVCITKYNIKELIEQNKDKKTIVETLREISKEIAARSSHAELISPGQKLPSSQHRRSEHGNKLKIFLCHSSDDKSSVKILYDKLQKTNVDPWLDSEKLLPGQDWEIEISRAVKKADVVIVCLSKNSVGKSGYIQKELKFALNVADEKPDGTIFIIPLKLEECTVPDRLAKWQWLNYYEDNAHVKLLSTLKVRAKQLGIEY